MKFSALRSRCGPGSKCLLFYFIGAVPSAVVCLGANPGEIQPGGPCLKAGALTGAWPCWRHPWEYRGHHGYT